MILRTFSVKVTRLCFWKLFFNTSIALVTSITKEQVGWEVFNTSTLLYFICGHHKFVVLTVTSLLFKVNFKNGKSYCLVIVVNKVSYDVAFIKFLIYLRAYGETVNLKKNTNKLVAANSEGIQVFKIILATT